MKTLLAFIIPIFFLMGCSTAPTERVVTQVEYKTVDIPEYLLKKCKATQPPNKETYIQADPNKRLEMLTELSIFLYQDLNNCNNQIQSIEKLTSAQKEIIKGNQDVK